MNIVRYLNQDPERPAQVTYAVFMLHLFLVISFVVYLVHMAVSLLVQPFTIPISTFVISVIIMTAIYGVMFFVAGKIADRKNWARWLLLLGFILLMAATIHNMPLLVFGDVVFGLTIMVQLLVTALAVALLFQESCTAWFKEGVISPGIETE